jgi:hypothetical protein
LHAPRRHPHVVAERLPGALDSLNVLKYIHLVHGDAGVYHVLRALVARLAPGGIILLQLHVRNGARARRRPGSRAGRWSSWLDLACCCFLSGMGVLHPGPRADAALPVPRQADQPAPLYDPRVRKGLLPLLCRVLPPHCVDVWPGRSFLVQDLGLLLREEHVVREGKKGGLRDGGGALARLPLALFCGGGGSQPGFCLLW